MSNEKQRETKNEHSYGCDCDECYVCYFIAKSESAAPAQPVPPHVCKRFDYDENCVECGAVKEPIVPEWERQAEVCAAKGHPLTECECGRVTGPVAPSPVMTRCPYCLSEKKAQRLCPVNDVQHAHVHVGICTACQHSWHSEAVLTQPSAEQGESREEFERDRFGTAGPINDDAKELTKFRLMFYNAMNIAAMQGFPNADDCEVWLNNICDRANEAERPISDLKAEWMAQDKILDYTNWLQSELLKARAPAVERKNMLHDLDHKPLQVIIAADGKKLWINDSTQCIFRAQNIGQLEVEDPRASPAVAGRTQGDVRIALQKLIDVSLRLSVADASHRACAHCANHPIPDEWAELNQALIAAEAALRESAKEAPSTTIADAREYFKQHWGTSPLDDQELIKAVKLSSPETIFKLMADFVREASPALAIFVQGLEKRVAKLEKEFPSVASPEPTDKESHE